MPSSIVILGAGQAGLQAAESLRSEGYNGALTLVGDEAYLPYQRPPLSKQYLTGDTDDERLTLRTAEVLAQQGIAVIRGVRAVGLDRTARRLALSDGRSLAYEGLVLATGARPRPLPVPGAELRGVIYVRGIDDAKALLAALPTARCVAIIGGGFIGLEIAATARKKFGKDVTVYEALPRLMARAVAAPTSNFFHKLHEANGVHFKFETTVKAIEGQDGRVAAILTGDGQRDLADLVIVGIGVIPNDDLARAAGLDVEHGIIVDACSRTSDPYITAAGDCTARRLDDGSLRRLESVQNAIEQAKSAAAALVGKERPFVAAPWFWSDQYDIKLQMAGLSAGHDELVMRGSPEERAFSVFYFKRGQLIAVDSMNRPADHVMARKLIEAQTALTPQQAGDMQFALKSALG